MNQIIVAYLFVVFLVNGNNCCIYLCGLSCEQVIVCLSVCCLSCEQVIADYLFVIFLVNR